MNARHLEIVCSITRNLLRFMMKIIHLFQVAIQSIPKLGEESWVSLQNQPKVSIWMYLLN
jgi:hypothetical protein